MYARSPDETMPPSGSPPSHLSVQLYPYHQQAFHQHYPGPQQEPQWSQATRPQLRPRPSFPSISTSLPPNHDSNRHYASPQSLYQGMLPNLARYDLTHPIPFGNPHRLSTLPQGGPHIHPQIPSPNAVQHQSYANHPHYASPLHHQAPNHNHYNDTLPYPEPSSAVSQAPSYSPPSESYAAAASIGLQPLPDASMPPPPFQENQQQQQLLPEKPPLPPPDDEHDDEREIALALAMSQADMLRKQNEEARLSSQEEEDLARALAESLQTVNQTNHLFGGESSTSATFASQAANSHQNKGDLSPLQLPIEFPPEAPTYVSASTFQPLKEDVGSKWQVGAAYNPLQEGPPSGASQSTGSPPHFPSATAASSYPTEMLPQDRLESLDNLPVYSDRLSSSLAAMESLQRTETDESRLVFDDEAYARQLLAEEEDQFQRRMEEKGRMEAERQQRPEPDRLPQYTSEGLLSPDMPPSDSGESSRRSSNANEVPQLVQSQPPRIVASSSTPSTFQSTSQIQSPFSANEQHPPLQTVNSSTSISSSTQSSQAGRPRINQHTNQARPHSSSMSSPDAGPSNVPQLTRHSSAGVVNPNHFLDRELLAGVSIGFKPPVLSMKLESMEEPMPNIISLPSKKCPPLHLLAPNWRHMLRLLARLSNTRIEPTIEAMSDSKAELKLRTVIQFVLPHPQAVNVWRTILWFTIDQHVPPTALGAARYTCGNPNVLPWSYTLSPMPLLLRNSSDTPMSKTYTVPATDAIPYPTLPITFPNLALYLHAVLEESRKHSRSDAVNGIGKLGKMVQMAYPSVREDDYDDDGLGRSSFGDLWKRVMGRGNKDKNKGKSNNETYQMVIPFVSDGWG